MRRGDAIVALFDEAFSASEGPGEGALVARLARALIEGSDPDDWQVFLALDATAVTGCIICSRLRGAKDAREGVLLSPVAVRTDRQGAGIGQALPRHGLHEMAPRGTDAVVTYGDPGLYGKLGFHPARPEDVLPPLPLTQPEGWLAISLCDGPLRRFRGASGCVAALGTPSFCSRWFAGRRLSGFVGKQVSLWRNRRLQ